MARPTQAARIEALEASLETLSSQMGQLVSVLSKQVQSAPEDQDDDSAPDESETDSETDSEVLPEYLAVLVRAGTMSEAQAWAAYDAGRPPEARSKPAAQETRKQEREPEVRISDLDREDESVRKIEVPEVDSKGQPVYDKTGAQKTIEKKQYLRDRTRKAIKRHLPQEIVFWTEDKKTSIKLTLATDVKTGSLRYESRDGINVLLPVTTPYGESFTARFVSPAGLYCPVVEFAHPY